MAKLSLVAEEPVDSSQPLFLIRIIDPPQPKERHRVTQFGRGGQPLPRPRTYTPTATADAAYRIRQAFVEKYGEPQPFAGPVLLRFTVWLKMPKNVPKYRQATILPTPKPDLPNMLMLLADALSGYAYADDSLITDLGPVRKRYAGTYGGPPHPCWEVEVFESVSELW